MTRRAVLVEKFIESFLLVLGLISGGHIRGWPEETPSAM